MLPATVYLLISGRLAIMTKFWPAFAVGYAGLIYYLGGRLAGGFNTEMSLSTLVALSFGLSLAYYGLLRRFMESEGIWAVILIIGGIIVAFGPDVIVRQQFSLF